MHHLIIDTCVWIELGTKEPNVRAKIAMLIDQGKAQLLVPQIVIDEWDRHKQTKVIDWLRQSFRSQVENAKGIIQYLDPGDAETVRQILRAFQDRGGIIDTLTLERVKNIEDLFCHPSTIILPVTDSAKLQAADLALAKRAPFRNKNSMADALIMFCALDYVRQNNLSNCLFVSRNTADFASPSDDGQLHEDLEKLFNNSGIRFFTNIGKAVNEIEEHLVSLDTVRRIDLDLQCFAWYSGQLERLGLDIASLASNALPEFFGQSERMFRETMRPMLDSVTSKELLESLERHKQMADETIRPFLDSLTSAEKLCKLIESVNRSMGGANQQNLGETVTESAEAQFTVYVNHPTSTVTIHSTACYYFRNRIADETPNGHWEKPLSCVEDAWKHAMAENKRTKRYCGTCLPGYQS